MSLTKTLIALIAALLSINCAHAPNQRPNINSVTATTHDAQQTPPPKNVDDETITFEIVPDGADAEKDPLTREERERVEKEFETLNEILEHYAVDALEKPKDLGACVREMMAMGRSGECADRYTHYESAADAKLAREERQGKFVGIGAVVTLKNSVITVVTSMPASPAEKAGLKPGDSILKVDGEEARGLTKTVSMIRGPEGTTVVLTIYRQGSAEPFEVKVVRREIVLVSVTSRLANGARKIGIVKVSGFGGNAAKIFLEHITTLRKQGAQALVIDLRNNPGGLLYAAVEMLSLFARPTDIVVTIRKRNREEIISSVEVALPHLPKNLQLPDPNFKVVVVVNGGSASASEIFAGAMKDWGYPVVGEKTFGKGIGQTVFPLSDGSELVLTTFEFLVGNNKIAIRDKGVTPTVEVKQPDEPRVPGGKKKPDPNKKDPQLEKAIELLKAM